jgi:hypothetical protein
MLEPDRRRRLTLAALALVACACSGDSPNWSPTAPASPEEPQPTPPPPPSSISEEAVPGTYERRTPHDPNFVEFHHGLLRSRFVLESDGDFRLEYESGRWGSFEYLGTYARDAARYVLDWEGWSSAGSWGAVAVFRGDCFTVEYNLVMVLSDFENGTYCR